jgi:hypothetical protein
MERQSLETFEKLPFRVALGTFKYPTEAKLRFIKLLGVDDTIWRKTH